MLTTRKYTQLDAVLAEYDADSAWFATPPAFAWLTGGGTNVVSLAGDTGVAAVGYDGENIVLVADHIEAERLREEELSVDAAVYEFDWYEEPLESAVAELITGHAVADFDLPDAETIRTPTRTFPLTDPERDRYRDLSTDAAEVVERVARDVTPVMTERGAAADLAHGLRQRKIDPLVVLVGGADRSQRYRHFTPGDATLDEYATLTVVGRRAGLHACLTRTVAFETPSWLPERFASTQRVAATALRATQRVGRDGGTAGDVFAEIQEAYAAAGYPDEWHEHHQGGMTGYGGREWFARPDSAERVTPGSAYAWNPTIQGTKVEDTALVTDDGVESLTLTGEWPTTAVDPFGDGDPVELPVPMYRD
ncbi:M24 family metallopeptidase [Haloarcula onubensis]|uniref:M24 family metallopeptidase n=1 Tax=Haloarcula onubensis TaxID=2950539 RepID=A0ABU2FKA7_9EURY|nr:M24 family metallopeptidase [Halomicroarcula sp. S3CR25-11]MDS0280687.1 M24 family metallopeptidase [Halomicroarcula sp. S3CR25-11]